MTEGQTKKSMNNKVLPIVVAFVFAALGFFGGMKYQQRNMPGLNEMRNGQLGARGGQFQRSGAGGNQIKMTGFRPVTGEVVSIDDKSMTVKLTDGSTKIVILSEAALYNKSTDGSKSDIKEGTKVTVMGDENSDGSVTAQNVQIDPLMRVTGSPQP